SSPATASSNPAASSRRSSPCCCGSSRWLRGSPQSEATPVPIRWQIVAAGITSLLELSAPAVAEDKYCDLALPPANASVDGDHGYYFFIFPNALPDHFTGCKTWW